MLPILIEALVKIALVIGALMTAAAYLVLLERWMAAWVQDRLGPNRVGIPLTKIRVFGLGQPFADGLKFLFKADSTPLQVDKAIYFLAPVAIFTAALAAFAVIPFGSVLPPNFLSASWHLERPIALSVAPGLDVGILYVFAIGGIAVYGVVLGGWASNNKYSFLGGLRSSAQLISYELPLGLGILGVVLASGSLRFDAIIAVQADSGLWNAFLQPLGFVVFCVAGFAEAARLPFDLPEAEQELVGGYHTEYTGVKLLMYLVAEVLHMIVAAFLIVILFLGGWHFWGLTDGVHSPGGDVVTWTTAVLRLIVMLVKVMGVILFFMLVRWSWPRFRFDQLMDLGWKLMLPWGFVNLVVVAICVEYADAIAASLDVKPVAVWITNGAVTLILSWWIASSLDPTASDNRPNRRLPGDTIELNAGEGES